MFSAIILAAGSSTRMNGANKQLAEIDGVPVFVLSALNFDRSDMVSEVIIAAPEHQAEQYLGIAKSFGIRKLKCVVSGGATRALSVKNALFEVSEKCSHIAIHDGARPLIPTLEIDRVLTDAEKYGAAIAAAPAADTVKLVGTDGCVESTPPRDRLYYAQTPQAFKKELYLECLEKLGSEAETLTDDSALIERCGGSVHITEMTCCNMKITRPDDLAAVSSIYHNRKTV